MGGKKKKTEKVGAKPTPIVLSINICDTVIRDERTKKVSLIGLFGVIYSRTFPAVHPFMHVHIAMTNGHGKNNIEVRFIKMSNLNPIISAKGDIEFPTPLQVVELSIEWQRVKFDSPGNYLVEVLCDGQKISDRKFAVLKVNESQLTEKTE